MSLLLPEFLGGMVLPAVLLLDKVNTTLLAQGGNALQAN